MIRRGTKDDRGNLLDLGFLMHQESIYASLSWDRAKAGTEFDWTLKNGIILVHEPEDRPQGMLLGHVKAPWFSNDKVGYEEALYLHPAHRGPRTAQLMVKYWEDWCKEQGATVLRASTSCGTFGMDRLYEALGFSLIGGNYVK